MLPPAPAPQQQTNPRAGDEQGEYAEDRGVVRLQIEGTEVARVQLDQPESFDPLGREGPIERTGEGREQERDRRQGHEAAVQPAEQMVVAAH